MKKAIVSIVILALLIGGYAYLHKYGRVTLSGLEGELVRVTRGDLDVPITASGRIEPASITKIKGEASGEVVETPQKIGEMVTKGTLIIRLNEDDEQRNVDRAEADYERARIALERAEISKEEAEKVGIPLAEAEAEQAEARLAYAKIEHDQKLGLKDKPDRLSRQEWETVQARLKEAQATSKAAAAKVEQARTSSKYASKDVDTMKQNVAVAQKTLEDARERLRETKVLAPIDGMVLKRSVEIGEVVQSGKTSLTGGTVLIELADVGKLYAVVNVDEADIGMVRELAPPAARPGPPDTQPAVDEHGTPLANAATLPEGVIDTNQQVEVTVESFPSDRFFGIIERIAPQSEVSQAIATFKVWIRITSANKSQLIGLLNLQAEAHFTAKSVRNALLVSYDAFQKNPDGEGFGVYVPVRNPRPGQKKYEFKPCEFGRDNGIHVEVVKGLTEGEEVYTKLPMQTRKEEKEAEKAEEE